MSTEFHRFTLSAAAEVVGTFILTHNYIDRLIFSWGLVEGTASDYVADKILAVAKLCASENPVVRTENGEVPLERAFIELALSAPPKAKKGACWNRLIAGLRFDGFEVAEEQTVTEPDRPWGHPTSETAMRLVRMLPSDIPELDFREAESEVEQLLNRHSFATATGHMKQAMNAFQRGDWAASNSQLRTFYQDLLDKIAENLGCDPSITDDAKRQYLADIKSGPFLILEYNEWENDRGRPSFILGLWARLHTHGSHPGLSEEGDAAFRLQITLITARLLMRRFEERKKSA